MAPALTLEFIRHALAQSLCAHQGGKRCTEAKQALVLMDVRPASAFTGGAEGGGDGWRATCATSSTDSLVPGVHLDDGDDLEIVIRQQLVVLGHLCALQELLEDGLVLFRPLAPQLLNDEPRRVAAQHVLAATGRLAKEGKLDVLSDLRVRFHK